MLATCHAVVEDTLIFVVLGANGWIMLGVRLLLAVTLTALLARLWRSTPDSGQNNHRKMETGGEQ